MVKWCQRWTREIRERDPEGVALMMKERLRPLSSSDPRNECRFRRSLAAEQPHSIIYNYLYFKVKNIVEDPYKKRLGDAGHAWLKSFDFGPEPEMAFVWSNGKKDGPGGQMSEFTGPRDREACGETFWPCLIIPELYPNRHAQLEGFLYLPFYCPALGWQGSRPWFCHWSRVFFVGNLLKQTAPHRGVDMEMDRIVEQCYLYEPEWKYKSHPQRIVPWTKDFHFEQKIYASCSDESYRPGAHECPLPPCLHGVQHCHDNNDDVAEEKDSNTFIEYEAPSGQHWIWHEGLKKWSWLDDVHRTAPGSKWKFQEYQDPNNGRHWLHHPDLPLEKWCWKDNADKMTGFHIPSQF